MERFAASPDLDLAGPNGRRIIALVSPDGLHRSYRPMCSCAYFESDPRTREASRFVRTQFLFVDPDGVVRDEIPAKLPLVYSSSWLSELIRRLRWGASTVTFSCGSKRRPDPSDAR